MIGMKKFFIVCFIFFTACKKSEDKPDDTVTTVKSASFKIGSSSYTVSNPYLGIFDNSGAINNTMTLTASDGSKIEFNFIGSSPSSYLLHSYSNAYYKNAAGKQYNSTSGELITSAYSTDGVIRKTSGTFHFKAKAIVAPIDSVEITDGVFTNASN